MNTRQSAKRPSRYQGPRNAASQNTTISKRDLAVMNRIIKEFKSRSRVDIDRWRNAVKEAENDRFPKRVIWGEISKDLDLDNHWSSQVLIRKLAVMCREFRIVDKSTGKENPDKTKLFKAPWFYRALSVALDAKFFGTKVIEIEDLLFGNYTKDAIYVVPTENLIPDKKEILLRTSSQTGYNYSEDDYIIQFDEEVFMGLLCKAAPQIIWKKNAQQSWAEFCEKFGIPMRYATTNKKDQQTIDRIEKMLDSLGSAARAVFPEGTTIDFKEADTKDAFNVFDKKIERCNSELSKLINGVTMMSDNGSSLSQSKVHFDVNKYIIESDAKDLYNEINWNIFFKLNKLKFPIDPAKEEFQWDRTETLGKQDQWNIVAGILKFFDVPGEWITEQFAVPVSGAKKNPVPGGDAHNEGVYNKVSKMLEVLAKLQKGDKLEGDIVDLITEVSASFNKAQSQPAAVEPFDGAGYSSMLQHCCGSMHKHNVLTAAENKIGSLFLSAAKAFFDNQNNKPSALSDPEWNALYTYVADKMWGGVTDGFGKSLATPDLKTPDEELLKKLRENMYVFSAFKNFQLMKSLNAELLDESGKIREWDDFKQKAISLNETYNLNWLRTEYDTAIASGQSAARWQQYWDEREDYDLVFRTIGDERVRDSHAALEGTVVAVDDSFLDRYYTPLDFNCRCEWEQIIRGSLVRTNLANVPVPEVPKAFQTNVGKSGQVFTEDHPYWNSTSGTDRKKLNDLAKDTIKKIDE